MSVPVTLFVQSGDRPTDLAVAVRLLQRSGYDVKLAPAEGERAEFVTRTITKVEEQLATYSEETNGGAA